MHIAFIGTSHVHTPDYLKVCHTLPWVELVGLAQLDHATLPLLSDVPPIFDRQGDLPEHDVAVLLTDAASHDEACAELTAPKVFIEKPLAVSHRRAQTIAKCLRQRKIEAEIGFFLRHSDAFRTLREACAAPEMGPVRCARFAFAHPGLLDGWLQIWPAHLSRSRMGGGAFVDLAIHLLDAANHLLGSLAAKSCELDTRAASRFGLDTAFETQGQATFTTETGALVHLWASAEAPTTELKIEMACQRGTALLEGGCVTRQYRNAAPEVLHTITSAYTRASTTSHPPTSTSAGTKPF